jgi:hypothetical protein
MKVKQFLLVALAILLSVSLLFGGSVHASLHMDGHGMDGHGIDGDGDCHLCELTLDSPSVELAPVTGGTLSWGVPTLAPPGLFLAHVLSHASPRAPPA